MPHENTMKTATLTLAVLFATSTTAASIIAAAPAAAAPAEMRITLRDHRYSPAEVRIPANTKVKLVVNNQDSTPEEFDSFALNREKVIPGRTRATIYIGPLAPGRYPFIGEFNAATAQSAVVVQ